MKKEFREDPQSIFSITFSAFLFIANQTTNDLVHPSPACMHGKSFIIMAKTKEARSKLLKMFKTEISKPFNSVYVTLVICSGVKLNHYLIKSPNNTKSPSKILLIFFITNAINTNSNILIY